MLLLIDNYDSFTYNLVQFFGDLGADCKVVRNDKISVADALSESADGIVLSPGPCSPNEAGICVDLIQQNQGRIPIFGVCLGHQSIGQAYGGKIVAAPTLMHGKVSHIRNQGLGVFDGLPERFEATRYHSLTIDPATLPDCLEVTAETSDGTIMGVSHKEQNVHGVQFHPESIASEHGHALLRNFLKLAKSS